MSADMHIVGKHLLPSQHVHAGCFFVARTCQNHVYFIRCIHGRVHRWAGCVTPNTAPGKNRGVASSAGSIWQRWR
jgi:hypothetical protein